MESSEKESFEKRTREILDESAGRLDGRTRSRLTQARHRALAQIDRPVRSAWRSFAPLGAGAAAAVLAVMLWVAGPEERAQVVAGAGSAIEDIDLLADADAPDFVSETNDLEFYEWAAGEIGS